MMPTQLKLVTPAKHSAFGFSGSSRWLACAGTIRMSKHVINESNPADELGTAAHELAEWCLRSGLNAFECIGLIFNKHKVDSYMSDAVQLYISYIRDLCRRNNVNPMLEIRVVMLSVRDDIYGTADCIIIIENTLYVFDYKHGFGIVDVKNNTQAIGYAIAALDTMGLWGTIKKVVTGIIQPRADHVDGAIRTAEYTVEDMVFWQQHFRQGVINASQTNAPLTVGKHCEYCPARGFCRPRIMQSLQLAYGDKPVDEMNEDEITIVFHEIKTIKRNLEAIEAKALEFSRNGKQIEGYKLVKVIARAKCEQEKDFVIAAVDAGVDKSDLYNQKLISMTAAKKLLQNNKGIVDKYFVKPPAATTLVELSDKRPAVAVGSAVGIFSNVNHKPVNVAGIFGSVRK